MMNRHTFHSGMRIKVSAQYEIIGYKSIAFILQASLAPVDDQQRFLSERSTQTNEASFSQDSTIFVLSVNQDGQDSS